MKFLQWDSFFQMTKKTLISSPSCSQDSSYYDHVRIEKGENKL